MTDNQGCGDLSWHGNPYLKTANLDPLHNNSIPHSYTGCLNDWWLFRMQGGLSFEFRADYDAC
ncbi:MAG: hypothetical protein HN758_09750 [Verrucomicrobia bacterium]|nr:hypothetical protein [Verrucomicrobiota bacterium]MBT4275668.1 hypothetical protein [Verrucomicrobiota bacterium]MBT5061960.1 hypothetical protein [Verrucomicrobiota bacterium]MBT5480619.1 hypothetical protein [Verrucomicrobiota bacterium]MBT6238219.1 hypothetical protein [Verrucomicrobiota bacterium]